jgi:hypothetical protein
LNGSKDVTTKTRRVIGSQDKNNFISTVVFATGEKQLETINDILGAEEVVGKFFKKDSKNKKIYSAKNTSDKFEQRLILAFLVSLQHDTMRNTPRESYPILKA